MKIREGLKNIKSFEDLEKLNDPEITKAFTRPEVPRLVNRVVNFLQDNQNLMTTVGGMSVYVTGLDRYKLAEVGRGYGIDIYRWMYAVDMYEKNLKNSFNNKED